MRDVELAHRGDEVALIEAGLNDGERVILDNLANAEAGMALKARDSEMAESTDSPSGDAAATPHQEGNA